MKKNLYDNPEFFNMYKNLRETKITYNDFIEQPAIRRLFPDLENLRVLDLGCGFAMARKHPQIHYLHGSMEEARFNNNEFDLVVSSLAFHYI